MVKHVDKIDEFDFGFSFADDVKGQVTQLENERNNDQQTIKMLEERLVKLHKTILPLLDNLCKDPDKSSIHWPDRVAKIEAFKKKLQSIVEGK